jgi:ribonuclease Z
MSERKFYALGTASQVPTRKRNHNGYFLRWDDQGFLFDPGEGTQRQMLFAGVSANEITKIFITHFHGDHCLGLAGILQRISLDNVLHPVEVYFPASGLTYFNNLKNASIYYDRANIVPCPFEEEGIIFENKHFTLTTLPLDHTVDCWGYRLDEKDDISFVPAKLDELGLNGPIIGHLRREGKVELEGRIISIDEVSILKPGQSFAFVMDTRECSNAIKLAKGVDMLVCESTFLNEHEKEAKEFGHLTAAQAAKIAVEANARLLVLTHFSQRYKEEGAFLEEAKPFFKNLVCMKDGDIVEMPKRKKLT